jgi:hypothetical protein
MSAVAGAVLDALQIAHDIGIPHQEQPPPAPGGSGGGASTIVILVGVVLTVAAVGALIWLKNRAD